MGDFFVNEEVNLAIYLFIYKEDFIYFMWGESMSMGAG